MKKQSERDAVTKEKEGEKYVTKGEIKVDYRNRPEVFEVKKDGVTVEWTANYTEAVSAQKQSQGSSLYSINMATGRKTLRG